MQNLVKKHKYYASGTLFDSFQHFSNKYNRSERRSGAGMGGGGVGWCTEDSLPEAAFLNTLLYERSEKEFMVKSIIG